MAEIPKIVGQRLRAVAKLGDHPDPNLLSAFVERSLGKREQGQVLEHLSRCTSCREIVSLSVTRPGIADVAPLVSASPGWLSWPVLRWGAAVACVVVVGAVVTLRQKQQGPQVAATIAEGKPAAELQLPMSNRAIDKKVASLQPQSPEAKTTLVAKPARPTGQETSNSSATQAVVAGPASAAPAPMNPPLPAVSGAMLAKAANRPNGITANAVAAPSPVEMADARTGSAFADVPGRAKDAPAESQDAQAEKAVGGALARKRTEVTVGAASDAVIPANLAPRWTLSSDGTLQRSLDSGRTWQTIPVSGKTIFRALAANGLDIWVGGAAGALFHSSDAGRHWTHVQPAVNGELLEDDIIGVEFTDTLHGKLTTSIAEIWITADAGQTWQKQ
jgi:hypothetical protein